jgi:hypothetical protein
MTLCTFDIKFPLGTQFIFGLLTFVTEKDEYLKMLPLRSMIEHPALASSISDVVCSGLDPFAGLYIRTVKLVRGISIVTPIL